jgi:hypothetical protein
MALPYSEQPNVLVAGHIGPVPGEHSSTSGVELALEDNLHTCALKTEVEPSDAREDAPDIHDPRPLSRDASASVESGTLMVVGSTAP